MPLDGLQAGYRHISLRTEGNVPLSLPTLFCHIVIKTYVPDGLGDFVDALNNPKEFLTKEEKRLKQLQDKLGIDEKEISVVPMSKSVKSNNLNNNSSQVVNDKNKKDSNLANTVNGNENENQTGNINQNLSIGSNKKEEQLIEKITRETLKTMKGFQKLLKKQTKEKEILRKKHNKEKALIQKQHSSIIDKMTVTYDKNLSNNIIGTLNQNIDSNNTVEINYKQKMKEIVDEQTRIWASLIEKQQMEEKQLNNEQVDQQCVCFQQLLIEAQKQRKKDLELKQKR